MADQVSQYSGPKEAARVLLHGIIKNDLHHGIPDDVAAAAERVSFTGSQEPLVPINWRFAESIAALKGFEAAAAMALVNRKYGVPVQGATVDLYQVDHASLFFMSTLLVQTIGKDGSRKPMGGMADVEHLFPSTDKYGMNASTYRGLGTSIYKTKDGKFYHIHGSFNPDYTLAALGLPPDDPSLTFEQAADKIQAAVSRFTAAELDEMMNGTHRQAGTIAYTADQFSASEGGKAIADKGLYTIRKSTACSEPRSWWPEAGGGSKRSSAARPLAGLKVVDLTRVIAGPAITRSLAELGASVMRVTSPDLPDLHHSHPDLNWGKWNCHLDLRRGDEGSRARLAELIRDADVVVDGYRPGAMEKLGFGREQVVGLARGRGRGILHVRENCYGWEGPWRGRSGWQQISDACTGVSFGFGRAMGLEPEEPVTPVFPNSDYCTGVAGSAAVLLALMRRAEEGGSYGIDVALNYYNQWLVRSVGAYPADVWSRLHARHGSMVFRHHHNMQSIIPAVVESLYRNDATTLFRPEHFELRTSAVLGTVFVVVKPVTVFSDGSIKPGYDVGTRGNGRDAPRWPEDLTVEVVE